MGTVIDPAPQLRALFAQFVLYVNFFFLVARPGEIDPRQHTLFDVALPLHLVEEIFRKVRVAKEQPVFTRCFVGSTLLHKGAERRDAGAWANHNHRGFRVSGQAEVIVMFDKYAEFALFFHAVREEAGGTTGTGAAFHVVTHHTNGDVYFVLDFRLRGGDGIQTRRQRAQQIN